VGLTLREEDLALLGQPLELLATPRRTIQAPNRIAHQPMEAADAETDGSPSPATFCRYVERASGGAGLEIVEALAVSPAGRGSHRQLVIHEGTRRGLETLVRKYRNVNPTTPIIFQLTHGGPYAAEPVTPYPRPDLQARLLEDADLGQLQEELVAATRIALACGADGIDFKHCHGYLLGGLLAPANRERPGWSWGGESLEARARFTLETLARMQEVAPPDAFLYMVRLSAFEGTPGGFGSRDPTSSDEDPDRLELQALARLLTGSGVRLLNVSAGVPARTPLLVRQTDEHPEGFLAHQARAALVKASAPEALVVGSGYTFPGAGRNSLPGARPEERCLVHVAARALREGRVDLVGLGRQSFADPCTARKLLSGEVERVRWCTTCNQCATAMRSGIHAGCVTHDPYYTDLFRQLRRREPV
jgi:2,4-dienoyl-CoA reductase-like NADH-dependent reductase (Old Yellow Enzyme family)